LQHTALKLVLRNKIDFSVGWIMCNQWFTPEGKKKKLLHHHCSVEAEFVMAVPIVHVFAYSSVHKNACHQLVDVTLKNNEKSAVSSLQCTSRSSIKARVPNSLFITLTLLIEIQ